MTPKFSVGEVVILQSVDAPEWNGEYSVVMVIDGDEEFQDPHRDILCVSHGEGYGYILDCSDLCGIGDTGRVVSLCWMQSSLRKKHQPGELSYSELLQSLTVKTGAPA